MSVELRAHAPKIKAAKAVEGVSRAKPRSAPERPLESGYVAPVEVKLDARALRTKSELLKLGRTILEEKSKGRRVALVFDIDNTLMDTRHRTLGAAKCFRYGGQQIFAEPAIERIGYRPDE